MGKPSDCVRNTSLRHSRYWSIKWYGGRGRFDINQGLAAASTVPPVSGLFIALVIQVPAVTAMAEGGAVPLGVVLILRNHG